MIFLWNKKVNEKINLTWPSSSLGMGQQILWQWLVGMAGAGGRWAEVPSPLKARMVPGKRESLSPSVPTGPAEDCCWAPNNSVPIHQTQHNWASATGISRCLPLSDADVVQSFHWELVKALAGWGRLLFILFEFFIMCKMFQAPLGDTKDSENTVSGGGSSP